MKRYIICLCLIMGIIYQPVLGIEEEKIVKKEQEIFEIEEWLLKLDAQKKSITEESEALAIEVKELKEKVSNDVTPWERFRLEDKLNNPKNYQMILNHSTGV